LARASKGIKQQEAKMAVLRHTYTPATIADALIARWQQVPPAIAGDCLNRDNCMNGRIAPISAGLTLTGVARTVTPMAGDNAAIHVMLALADPGDIIVVAGGGNLDIALMGGLMIEAAKARGIGGVIVDGAVRDLAELRASGVPVFAAGACPRGPHKGFGGRIDGAAACGDVAVHAGDLILGDDDGVAVVPQAQISSLIDACEAKMAAEEKDLVKIRSGVTTVELQGLEIPKAF
jgi:regulator of RNase E activity RraA